MSRQLQQIGSGRQAGTLALIAAGIIVVIIVVLVLFLRPDSDPGSPPSDIVAPPVSKDARGDAARDIIAELRNTAKVMDDQATDSSEEAADDESLNETVDIASIDEESVIEAPRDDKSMDNATAYAQAQAFHAEGKLADAQLLYFFAARGGHAPAAFDLATFYDPNHFSKQASLMNDPDPYQAYKWYRQSLQLGIDDAEARLTELHAWAENAAGTGDMKAEQLLLVWE